MNPTDSRVLRTKKALLAAADSLLVTQDKITVADILKRADVTRATYYHYFSNVDELLRAANENRVQDLLRLAEPTVKVANIFAYVAEHANFFHAVWHEGRNQSFDRLLQARALQKAKQQIALVTDDRQLQEQLFEQYQMLLAMLQVVLKNWLQHDLTPGYDQVVHQFEDVLRFQIGGRLTALQLFDFSDR